VPKIIENVKESLILEGRKTLIEKSYKELNIRDIAKNVGIAIGTFYNYFPNKEVFVYQIFMDDWKNTLDLADSLKNSEEPLKEKVRKIYLSMQDFVDRYISIFYEIAMLKGYESKREYDMRDLYIKLEEILTSEKENGNIQSPLSPEKLSHFIISNLMYLSKNKYITFDEMFQHMNI
jgi:AcrR family transcriptional regulator